MGEESKRSFQQRQKDLRRMRVQAAQQKAQHQNILIQRSRSAVPIRLMKATLGLVLVIPLVFFAFGVTCFAQDKWPWQVRP